MAKIVILGGGFAAVSAAETLASGLARDHEIVLVSKSSDLTFFPAIVPMVFGNFDLDDLRFDLRPGLSERNIKFVRGDVRSINISCREVGIACDRIDTVLNYDYLIIALGPRIATQVVPGLSKYSHHLFTVDAAVDFKRAVSQFTSGSIVLGLCPGGSLPVPVCESALALAERFASDIKHRRINISVVFPGTLERAFAGSTLFRDIEDAFDRKGIRLVSDFAVTEVDESNVYSALGPSMKYDLLMLVPPVESQLSIRNLGPLTDTSGFLNVNALMQVNSAENVYAAGDIISLPGPKFGYMAMRQGRTAAANILAELAGNEPSVEYVHKLAWAIGEKYTDPVFFHYGFWDDTLDDFDDKALFGMARKVRDRYGRIAVPKNERGVIGA